MWSSASRLPCRQPLRSGRAPITAPSLDRERNRVIIDSAQFDQELPAHRARPVTRTEEVVVDRRVEGDDVIIRDDALDTRPTRDLPPPDGPAGVSFVQRQTQNPQMPQKPQVNGTDEWGVGMRT